MPISVLLTNIRKLFLKRRAPATERREPLRLHLLPSTICELRDQLAPRQDRHEPLTLLWARFAAEGVNTVVVGVKAVPFPNQAYVAGSDGANFDVHWLMNHLDAAAEANAGALLCHQHMHHGRPAFSSVDRRTNDEVMAKQRMVNDHVPYGAMVLSLDDAHAVVATADGMRNAIVRTMPEYSRFSQRIQIP